MHFGFPGGRSADDSGGWILMAKQKNEKLKAQADFQKYPNPPDGGVQ